MAKLEGVNVTAPMALYPKFPVLEYPYSCTLFNDVTVIAVPVAGGEFKDAYPGLYVNMRVPLAAGVNSPVEEDSVPTLTDVTRPAAPTPPDATSESAKS